MANASKTTQLLSAGGGKFNLTASFNETSTSAQDQTSTLSLTATLASADGSNFSTSYKGTLRIYWYDNNERTGGTQVASVSVGSVSSGSPATATGTLAVKHKSDGTLSGYAKAVWESGTYFVWKPASGNISTSNTALTPLATPPTGLSVDATSVSAFSATVSVSGTSWGVGSTVGDGRTVGYRKLGETVYTYLDYDTTANITTPVSFTIPDLTPNTTYQYIAKAFNSAGLGASTLAYPKSFTTKPPVYVPQAGVAKALQKAYISRSGVSTQPIKIYASYQGEARRVS